MGVDGASQFDRSSFSQHRPLAPQTVTDSADQRLRYKDFFLASKPALIEPESESESESAKKSTVNQDPTGLFEVASVSEFGGAMEKRGISNWWRRAMDFA